MLPLLPALWGSQGSEVLSIPYAFFLQGEASVSCCMSRKIYSYWLFILLSLLIIFFPPARANMRNKEHKFMKRHNSFCQLCHYYSLHSHTYAHTKTVSSICGEDRAFPILTLLPPHLHFQKQLTEKRVTLSYSQQRGIQCKIKPSTDCNTIISWFLLFQTNLFFFKLKSRVGQDSL